ncbi:MAG: bifunctional serine/threonine-protein kinase/formylglycine-generating enzyme family protein [Bryobacteraceae bacterium]|nr:protein kinase [Solibacteraceae bacterium]MCO5353962.1 bifunctional serine/threonine-protein kinase/formylglycine-generating enzyme family protein [Bryobacteraceae bacterium]
MQLPVRFGKYELTKYLGGGMSRVYKARDTVLGRTVAVKILTPEGISDADTRTRFLQEAKVSAALVHDHIIRIFDYGEEQGYPFIVMEFLVGSDLKGAIKDGQLGDEANMIRIALEGARALQFTHENKLIHRDIKPDNLHVDDKGRVRLMDFGIAKTEDVSLTKTGFQVGTPFYMAPEQVNGDKATERTDVYAYGMVLYEMWAGMRAIQGTTIQSIFAAILHQPIDLGKLREKNAPEALIALVERMTAKDPMARPGSFLEVISELEKMARALSPAQADQATVLVQTGGGAAEPGISGKKLIMALVPVVVVLVIVVTWLVMRQRARIAGVDEQGQPPPAVHQTETGEMLVVPAGSFLFGNENARVMLPVYYVDKTEVPNVHFNRYLEATGQEVSEERRAADPKLPAVNVTYEEAAGFCGWAGKRLPLPMEWEKAARGVEGWDYPWGERPDVTRANVGGHDGARNGPVAVDAMPETASPYGMLHMAGNVWEWVNEKRYPSAPALQSMQSVLDPPPTAEEEWRLAKGGSFAQPVEMTVVFEYLNVPSRARLPILGFRCVWAPEVK